MNEDASPYCVGSLARGYSKELSEKVKDSFNNRFWNEEKGCLYDVVDKDDDKIRPNQIWAVSLPFSILDKEKEKRKKRIESYCKQ